MKRQVNYLSVRPVRARNDRRVQVTVSNGIQRFTVYNVKKGDPDQDFDLFTDRGFLWLGNPGQSITAQSCHWSLHSLNHTPPEIPNFRSSDRILQIDNRLIFYLCREVTRNTVMYFILPQPRRNSSLCTFVFLYTIDIKQEDTTSNIDHSSHHFRSIDPNLNHPANPSDDRKNFPADTCSSDAAGTSFPKRQRYQ
jgi:hypothetical protein